MRMDSNAGFQLGNHQGFCGLPRLVKCSGLVAIIVIKRNLFMKAILVITAIWIISLQSFSQCADCVPDPGCTSSNGFPTICPDQLPPGESGEYYEQVVTFFLPAVITDPGSGISANLESLVVNAVSGLPFGVSFVLDDEDGTYHPGQGQTSGCATICGTPLLPGVYTISISVTANLTAFNNTIVQNETFAIPFEVIEGEGGTDSFSMNPAAACGASLVTFEATLAGQYPQVTTYAWDFGNGVSSDSPGPHTFLYDEPGTYEISLNTVISNLALNVMNLTSLAPGWGGDIDEGFGLFQPDPFFQLRDADGVIVFTSSTLDNTQTGSWTGLNVILSNPPYTLIFWDEDLVTPNDFLGEAPLTLVLGNSPFSTGTGTSGNLTIGLSEVNNITSVADLNVFPEVDASFSVAGNLFTCNELNAAQYVWFRNGLFLSSELSCQLIAAESGVYELEVTNVFGCTATSDPFLYCAPVTPVYNPAQEVITVPQGFESYQWFFNGLPLEGETSFVLNNPLSGNYGVTVTTSFGCTIQSTVITVTVGLEEAAAPAFRVWPNPATDFVAIETGSYSQSVLTLYDMMGREVGSRQLNGSTMKWDVSGLTSGNYVFVLSNGDEVFIQRFFIQP